MTVPPFDYPATREVIHSLDDWLRTLAAPCLPLVRTLHADGKRFHWSFKKEDAYSLLVGKAVRMVSSIRAALVLVDEGYTTEGIALLRITSEFHNEIIAVGEGIERGTFTSAQSKFVRQFYEPLPLSQDEFEKKEKESYVNRKELYKAHRRLFEEIGKGDETIRAIDFLNFGYDKYVHGHVTTATELYDPESDRFLVNGDVPEHARCAHLRAIAGKTLEVVNALTYMAMLGGQRELFAELEAAGKRLADADEQGYPCT